MFYVKRYLKIIENSITLNIISNR